MDKLAKSFGYALKGVKIAWSEERNFKIEISIGILAVALGLYFDISHLEWAALALTITLVLAVEALNTALEELCDKFQPTEDPHVAKIKDLAAAAVLIVSLGAIAVGLCIFIPYFFPAFDTSSLA